MKMSGFAVGLLGALWLATHPPLAFADLEDEESASHSCAFFDAKRTSKECCRERLSDDKHLIPKCIKLTDEKKARGTPSRTTKQAEKARISAAVARMEPAAVESGMNPSMDSPATTTDTIKQTTDLLKEVQGLKGKFGF